MDINEWEQKDKDLADRMDAYEKVFIHRKPCKEYKKIGWCPHVEQAIARKFKTEVREQIGWLASQVATKPPFTPQLKSCGFSGRYE